MLNWIKGLFKKKEPEKTWGEFKRIDKCSDCGFLQRNNQFGCVCPNCGSRSFKKVTARWLTSHEQCTPFMGRIINHESEIRED